MEIKREEVLRYLGSSNLSLDGQLEELISSCISEVLEISRPKYIYETFKLKVQRGEVSLLDKGLTLKGEALAKHLEEAMAGVFLAATLGVEIERAIIKYQLTNLTRGVILDATASVAIEALCDQLQQELISCYQEKRLYLTSRFSPGYGDLSLTYQGKILELLKAQQRIGLMATEENLLVPRKSVTAIIGITPKAPPMAGLYGCLDCNLRESCKYRREAGNCGDYTRDK